MYNSIMSTIHETIPHTEISENLVRIRQRIAIAAERVGRDPSEIMLVAVSKTKPFSMIESALAADQLDFGENRFEDAWQKIETAQSAGLDAIRWHYIGTIQSRKTAQAVGPFTLVHSIDREKVANRLSSDAEAQNCVMPVLLQANVSGEESKHGFSEEALMDALPRLAQLPGIRIAGLMTMAPFVADPEETRPVFQAMRQLQTRLSAAYQNVELHHLSMGMTNDFEVAIEEGATIVRIGSAIFGER